MMLTNSVEEEETAFMDSSADQIIQSNTTSAVPSLIQNKYD
jgi:hypothetical protein